MKCKERMISFLLKNANPSIVYRVKKEILGDLSDAEGKQLQERIMSEKIIKKIVACQKPNGWLGNGYHGSNKNAGQFENQEVGTKYLAEKGVDREADVLKRAMIAFKELPFTDPCYSRSAGEDGDEFRYAANGHNLFRCACIARAGFDDLIDIKPQISLALDSFRRVLEVDSILDITHIRGNNERVFNDFEKWPCRYHLDILAHTDSWKTEENCRMLAEAVNKMMRRDRTDLIGVTASSWVGHVLRTAGCFPSQGFHVVDEVEGSKIYNLEYLVWLARCGVIKYCPELQTTLEEILQNITDDGVSDISVDNMFRNWGPYGGMQLEVDWRSKIRRQCDITFRTLQLCHYVEAAE